MHWSMSTKKVLACREHKDLALQVARESIVLLKNEKSLLPLDKNIKSTFITRPNAKKAGPAICAVPDDRILIETDAPDILPTTAEGDLNEPANLRLVLAKAAELRGVSEESLAETTFRNAERFFFFP